MVWGWRAEGSLHEVKELGRWALGIGGELMVLWGWRDTWSGGEEQRGLRLTYASGCVW